MKNFLTSMLGAFAALLLFTFGATFIFIGFLGVIAALGNKPVPIEDGAYLVFDLSVNITDAPVQLDGAMIIQAITGGGEPASLQLLEVTRALEAAASDPRIAGLLLVGEMTPSGFGSGFATLKEVRKAIVAFKAAGKPVQAYLEQATTREYYLATAADDLVLDPYGLIAMPGLASEPVFFAGAFEKFGIGIQVTRVGKYKSAVEPFTRTDLSSENREQYEQLLGDLWTDIVADVAAGRGMEPAQIQAIVDAEGIMRAETAVASNLVTRAAYRDEIIAELKERADVGDSEETFPQIGMGDYIRLTSKSGKGASGGHVAVVYAEGEIVDGEGLGGDVGGVSFARRIRQLRQDDDVKAIVLRVNSPGGSASASEHIQRELRLARESKPVIVSMGSYAASGGYWISAYGNRIFAEPSTVTGSIGVFGVLFDIQRLANETLGITFDSVKTGHFADAFTISRPKTPEEMAVIQRMVDWIYDEFVGKVADARGLQRAVVEEIAQGRVWSGVEALNLGLVDELGGLEDALAHAAAEAGLGEDYRLVEYPRKKDFSEALSDLLGRFRTAVKPARGGLESRMMETIRAQFALLESFNDPKGVYARLPVDLRIR